MSCKFLHPTSPPEVDFKVQDLFQLPATQNSIASSTTISVTPINAFDSKGSSPIEFLIPGASSAFVDLNQVFLYMKVGVKFEDGSTPGTSSSIYPANQFGISYLKSVEVFLNDVPVDSGPLNYSLSNHIGYMFGTSNSLKNGLATASGYYTDEDEFKERFKKSTNKIFDTYTRLSTPLFNQEKLLISNVDVKIRIIPNDAKYYLMCSDSGEIAKLPYCELLECYIVAKKCVLTPATFLAIENKLQSDTAKYLMQSVVQRQHILPANITSYSINSLQIGTLPDKILLLMQNNQYAGGNYEQDCYKFENFDLSTIALHINGVVSNKPYVCSFNKDGKAFPLVARAFHDLHKILDDSDQDGNSISMVKYNKDSTIFAFDLSTSYSDCSTILNPIETGDVSIKLTFATALPAAVTCNILLAFSSVLEIDGARQIIYKQL
ncbi:unnamed protein product [Rotaria magnacalcarata]|uniref:Uncharacterized protein n=1 Tax=Rotaria magnacalcarata TaxID=392030 RepID=A0A816M5Q5_9BILA|nr:unnamed protein product [Rotaria magnacalcarata]CAF4349715.1 unnamed protein product [Rotaria magnacalcarata]